MTAPGAGLGAWRPGEAKRRQAALCAVVVGHAALLLLVWQARRLPAGVADGQPTVVLRILPVQLAAAVPERRWQAPPPALRPPVTGLILPPAVLASPGADAAVSAGAAPGSEVAARPAGLPGTAASGAKGLDLKPTAEVLRGALVNPATVDPRSNSPKPTFEERIAMGLDPSLCVKLERDPDGTVRRRMGRLGRAQSQLQSTHGVGAQGLLVCE